MNRLRRIARTLAFPAFVLLLVGILHLMNQADLKERCEDTRVGRIQGNERAEVIRQFLEIAKTARAQSAENDTSEKARQINEKAAADYLALQARVKDVPLPEC